MKLNAVGRQAVHKRPRRKMAQFGKDYRSVERWLTDAGREQQRDITISYKEIHVLPRFSDSITNLTLKGLPLSEINRLPANLLYLTIIDCPIHRFTCELPKTLMWIHVNTTFLKELPPLPPGLEYLSIQYADLQSLPQLPVTLQSFDLINVTLRQLPPLPHGLTSLRLQSLSRLSTVPSIPAGISTLVLSELPIHELPEGYGQMVKRHPYCCIVVRNCPYLPPQKEGESSVVYALRLWDMQEREAMARAATRARAIHEELASVVWRPARIAAALEAGVEPEDL